MNNNVMTIEHCTVANSCPDTTTSFVNSEISCLLKWSSRATESCVSSELESRCLNLHANSNVIYIRISFVNLHTEFAYMCHWPNIHRTLVTACVRIRNNRGVLRNLVYERSLSRRNSGLSKLISRILTSR